MGSDQDVIPVGIYWDQQVWDLARSAYVADLDSDPASPDAFVGWLHQAIDRYAARTPAARAQLLAELEAALDAEAGAGVGAGVRGISKTYPLKQHTIDALEQAIVDDRRDLGRMVSRSGFVQEAARAAAVEARRRRGRELPPAPARLPNRPPRRAR